MWQKRWFVLEYGELSVFRSHSQVGQQSARRLDLAIAHNRWLTPQYERWKKSEAKKRGLIMKFIRKFPVCAAFIEVLVTPYSI